MPGERVALLLSAVLMTGCGWTVLPRPQQLHVDVREEGFVPSRIEVRRGRRVVVTFTRRVDQTCATDVMFPRLHRGYDLPLNRPVRVELAAGEVGDSLRFTCSTGLLIGMIVER